MGFFQHQRNYSLCILLYIHRNPTTLWLPWPGGKSYEAFYMTAPSIQEIDPWGQFLVTGQVEWEIMLPYAISPFSTSKFEQNSCSTFHRDLFTDSSWNFGEPHNSHLEKSTPAAIGLVQGVVLLGPTFILAHQSRGSRLNSHSDFCSALLFFLSFSSLIAQTS
jgi:hypothetical protein